MPSMVRRLPAFVLYVLLIQLFCSAGFAADSSFWRTDYAAALREAKEQDKLVLLHFYADYCMPCKKMDRETLGSSELGRLFGEKIIAVKINGETYPEIRQKFGVQMYPSDVFINGDEQIEAQSSKALALNEYIELIERVEGKYSRIAWIKKMREQAEKEAVAQQTPVDNKVPVKLVELEKVPLALDGYSPVSLRKSKAWVKGSEEFYVEHKGFRYQFASEAEVAEFQKDPSRYVPRLLGCDPVEMWEKDKAIYGTTRYGAYYNGDLYLFASDYNRRIFKESPSKFTQVRHVQRIEDIEISMLK